MNLFRRDPRPLFERYEDEEAIDFLPPETKPDPAHSLLDSWYFLIPGALIVIGILLARAWGRL